MTPLDNIKAFQNQLLTWFSKHGEDYPWRRTEDPYAILVSEIMLQQTQIATVLNRGYYTRWMETFPDVFALAAAEEQEVLRLWEGLGYYQRARNLHRCAKVVAEQYKGIFPKNLSALEKLPGLGKYTAGAVLSFAFNKPAPIVDANVIRVFARLFDLQQPTNETSAQKKLWQWAGDLVSQKNPRAYNSALMELGQKICLPKTPHCTICPVQTLCSAKSPEQLPIKAPKTKIKKIDEHCLFCIDEKSDRLLLHHEQSRKRQGLWKLPQRDKAHCAKLPLLHKSTYTITHHRVTLFIYKISPQKITLQEAEHWKDQRQLHTLPMPSPYRRVLKGI